MQQNQAILVLGMHRSGTSALARVLDLMGAAAGEPDELLPVHPTDNPTGYWERAEFNALHDALLATTGHAWDRLAGFDARALDMEAAAAPLRGLQRLVDRLDASGQPWIAKDPRLCLLLPVWFALRPDAACVVVVRDPREIAASMWRGPRGTFTSAFVLALWEKYMRLALAGLQGRPALFVAYDALLAEPQAQCERLLRALAERGVDELHAPMAAELSAFLDMGLRRSVPRPHVALTPAQEALTQWLRTQCRAPANVPVSGVPDETVSIDATLAEFEAAFAYHVEHGRVLSQQDVTARLDRMTQEFAQALAEQARDWGVRIDAARNRAESLAVELASAVHERDAARQQHETAAKQLGERAVELHRLQAHADGLAGSVNALRNSLSWKLTAPLRGLVALLRLRPHPAIERGLYRLYYKFPGLTPARKRAAILWLHKHTPWLTRHTLSYQLYAQTEKLVAQRTRSRAEREQLQRIDEPRAAAALARLKSTPTISIVMPVYNVERRWLSEAVESVRRQFYPHWQLCIADDCSTREETRSVLDELAALGDERIVIKRLEKNLGIGGASNAALALATGEFVGLLDNDDVLTRDALLEVAQRIDTENPDLIYSDEDKLDERGVNVEPYFKSDYSPDYLLCNNYLCHFSVLRRQLFLDIGGFQPGFDGAQDFDLMLRAVERARRVAHIPKILYHWRKIPGSTAADASGKPYTHEAGRRAIAAALQRRGIEGTVESGPFPNTYRVRRAIRGEPMVSILLPFRDKPELLRACVESILARSTYKNYEIVGIDNGSTQASTHALIETLQRRDPRVRFVRYEAPFNYSAINNFGAKQARGEHLLFLNNDTEVIAPQWLEAMLEHSQRPEVGAAGAKLLYSDDTIQHAGIILGLGGVAGHSHLMQPGKHHGYFSRPQLIQNLSAVTFACAMTRRAVFEELGGLNESDLGVAYNDVDYCLRAREAGYLIVYTPYAELYHHESKSRGYENDSAKRQRLARETAYMQRRHALVFAHGDPYYNPYLSLSANFEPDPRYADELPL